MGIVKAGLKAALQKIRRKDPPLPLFFPEDDSPIADFMENKEAPVETDVRAIAFYLPQFHAIPENDAWWGKGFTEWTNVRKAVPLFDGHYQPHVPHPDLGYYDLSDAAVLEKQAKMARQAGIAGFCFYHYWFGGKRLLEMPVNRLLKTRRPDFPFCLCWANENWTRQWDGLDEEVLMAQQPSQRDEELFILELLPAFRDARYIRVQGRPLFLVYRPMLLLHPRRTFKRWRRICREKGIGEIYLAGVASFKLEDPLRLGLDAVVEFPPNLSAALTVDRRHSPAPAGFKGKIYDYRAVRQSAAKPRNTNVTVYRGVTPSWDNTARRGNRATVLTGASPEAYGAWLRRAVDLTRREHPGDQKLVFINAWNEWAEGCHLEPDERFGYAWLNATRRALEKNAAPAPRRILLVSHDAHPHGGQMLTLAMIKSLSREFHYAVDLVLLGSGLLKKIFARYAELHDLTGAGPRGPASADLARRLRAKGHETAICNTTVSGLFLQTLQQNGFRTVSLIHELSGVLEQFKLKQHAQAIAAHADRIVFPARQVREEFNRFASMLPERCSIRPQGLYKRNVCLTEDRRLEARLWLRRRLSLPENFRIILGMGYGDHRKGADLFVDAGLALLKRCSGAALVWLGHWDESLKKELLEKITAAGMQRRILFPGLNLNTDAYYAGCDVFALTSREDPFPSVVLEAMDAGVPVVGFEGAGGFTELLQEGCGLLAPAGDSNDFAVCLQRLLDDPALARRLGRQGQERIRRDFFFRDYIFDLLEFSGKKIPRVSVIVPNYNYARFLAERIASIAAQTHPLYELIILDDASTDGSPEAIPKIAGRLNQNVRWVLNDRNSGSVFSQWLQGLEHARGDFVWIAEADDSAEPGFLEEVLKGFSHPSVVMSYCQSKQMDAAGKILCGHYLDYVSDISRDKWLRPHVCKGPDEIRQCLAVKNTIPNVSAAVFRRQALLEALRLNMDQIRKFRVAGDWLAYVKLLEQGDIAFSPSPLNKHRRHENGVTLRSLDKKAHLEEIISMQGHIGGHFALAEKTKAIASSYVRRLSEDFGLEAPALPPSEEATIGRVLGARESGREALVES